MIDVSLRIMTVLLCLCAVALAEATEIELAQTDGEGLRTLTKQPDDNGQAIWWLPPDAGTYTLPITAGIVVSNDNQALQDWLIKHSPFHLLELPAFGAAYGDQALTIIAPWPHYAELIAERDGQGRFRVGIRFEFPEGRAGATPCTIVVSQDKAHPLAVAHAFRAWRASTDNLGGIPKPLTLREKAEANPLVARLYGAPHIYLWGPALFSRHDVDRRQWRAFAKELIEHDPTSAVGKLVAGFSASDRAALGQLSKADWPMVYLTRQVALAIDSGLRDRGWLVQPDDRPLVEVIRHNRETLAKAFPTILNDPATWGDALSTPVIDTLGEAGLEHALLLLSDLYPDAPRPDIAKAAHQAAYLLGRYDSYHSVHHPDAGPDDTWATAQFDRRAYEEGRILNADGSGHGGFKGRGYHLAPGFAMPYVKKRVEAILSGMPQTSWFIDCDAAYEYFDDYRPGRPATRVDDVNARRQRLIWLHNQHHLVVGSEGGSALFSDVIAYGQGVQTPYIGHLDPGFRDKDSKHFLGRHWPPEAPGQSFDPVPVPASLITPFFDPTVRVPLYAAALGDQLVTTHHWSFDSFKLSDVVGTRELMELISLSPPTYHLSRSTMSHRIDRIRRHCAFWSPLHRAYADKPLTSFAWLTDDKLVQQTVFGTGDRQLTMTVNFDHKPRQGLPAQSAKAEIAGEGEARVYRVNDAPDRP